MKVPEKLEDITLAWLQDIFKPHGIDVHNFKLVGEASNGRGFMGNLERVDLEISHLNNNSILRTDMVYATPYENEQSGTETLSIILKTLPNDPMRRQIAANEGFCSREVCMYTEIFREWDQFLDSRQMPQANRYRHPFCYYGAEEGEGDTYKYILVLENLTSPKSPYQLWAPGFSEPLAWSAASAVIRQIARFHATGIAYRKENRIKSYSYRFPQLNHTVSQFFVLTWKLGFEISKEILQSLLADNDEIPDGLFEQLDNLRDNGEELILKWFTDPTMDMTDRATVSHNDLHSNNLVVSRDFTKAVFFDYQACCSFNPMNDLTFFLIQNCELEDITTNISRALTVYHEEFHATFKAMNLQFEYSLENLRKDYDLCLAFSLCHVMTGAGIWLAGTGSNEIARKKRFAKVLIDTFQRGLLNFPTEPFVNV